MEKKIIGSNTLRLVKGLLSGAVEAVTGVKDDSLPIMQYAKSSEFDYQSAFAQKIYRNLAKTNEEFKKKFPDEAALVNEVGKKMVEKNDLIRSFQISENGFLLLLLSDKYLGDQMNKLLKENVSIDHDPEIQTIVVDFSSPNIAKEMHVGHLRSTILGESICRVLEAKGHKVLRVNHVGDWGTQFGMLIAHMQDTYPDYLNQSPNLKDLEAFYAESKKRFDSDASFKERAQKLVVKLQSGDEGCLKAWKILCDVSRAFFHEIYKRLDIKNEEFGESFYNPMIPGVLEELKKKDLTKMDKGALCMYIPKKKLPLMLVKSDGGFNYDTTDVAAAWYRLTQLKAQRVIYLTDVGQYPHFELVFEAAKLAGWHTPPKTRMEHMGFGLVLGPDGEKMKTRNGKNVKLMDLLDEARDTAEKELENRGDHDEEGGESKKKTQLSTEEFKKAAEVLGIDAVKYFDMRQNRMQNYKFEMEAMVSQKGDTAVYLMYSYIRLCSILRKCGIKEEELKAEPFEFTHEQERLVARHLVKFSEALEIVVDQLTLNRLCEFVYDLASKIAESYPKYKILNNEHSKQRLKLILIAKLMMEKCFHLLNLKTIDKI